jgi:hypothetical protein
MPRSPAPLASRSLAAGAALLLAAPAPAQPAVPAAYVAAPVPFAVGEELVYRATFGGVPAGTARMRVEGIVPLRGRHAYHVVFTLDGGIPFFRVHDRYESWIDVETLASLRHRQQISEGRYRRTTTYEIYPERAEYQKNDEPPQPSVGDPLDEGSFLYAMRMAGLRVGETRSDARYFRPDRNPVVLTAVRQETVTVGAGTFVTTVVRPTIRASGLFAEDGEAQVWLADDASRYPVQVRARFARLSLALTLSSVTHGGAVAAPLLAAAPTP